MQSSVVTLRRYPVKSMGGEALGLAELDARGLVGDRWYAVEDDQGRFASGKDTRRFRRRDPVFDFSAHTDTRGQVMVTRGDERWAVDDPHLDQRLSREMGTHVRVRQDGADARDKWLKSLAEERDMFLAVYAEVTRPGHVTVGDRVRAV